MCRICGKTLSDSSKIKRHEKSERSIRKKTWVPIEIKRQTAEIKTREIDKVSIEVELLQGQISFQMGFGV